MDNRFEVIVVGGGIAGGALATVLARHGMAVAILERDLRPVDRVRGEFMAPWGVMELKRLGLIATLTRAGGIFSRQNVPYDETLPGDEALPFTLRYAEIVPDAPGALCMSHPAMCEALAVAAEAAGATIFRGIEAVEVEVGVRPKVSATQAGRRAEWTPRLVIGADGRNSQVRKAAGFGMLSDPPHNLIGGMLVEGMPEWPQDTQVIGTEERAHFLVFPQGGDRVRLYLAYDFSDKAKYAGPQRQQKLIETFADLKCLPQASMIAMSKPIGPFNAFSNEDHWVEDPTAPGVVLIGDAAGHNDPVTGQGLSIALRDVRLVSEVILSGRFHQDEYRPYVEERLERMRRLRIAARLATKLRVEFGEEARLRRQRVNRRIRVEKMPSPGGASLLGPDKIPAINFEQSTLDALLAP